MKRTRSLLPWVVAVLALLLVAGCTPMPYWQDEVVLVPVWVPEPRPHPPVPRPRPAPPSPPPVDLVQAPPRSTPAAPVSTPEVTKTRDRDTTPSRGPVRVDTSSTGTTNGTTRTKTR